ncbi:MAG: lipopolysaccharide heptosyltransferase I, partial [Duodenibacillus sp.]|nr:lipopolysaccharide heptosyltransferase I [Duodenibacillus sp.]
CVVTAFRRWRKRPFSAEVRAEVAALKARLAAERYDLVIDLQGLLRSAMVARWSKARSIGYSRASIREKLASFLYTETRHVPVELGPVRRYRTMAAVCLGYEIDAGRPAFGLEPRAEAPLAIEGGFAALAVNTSRDEKLWPERDWIELGGRLAAEGLASVLFWGSPAERARCERIAAGIEGAVVAPRLTLAELAAQMKRSRLVVGVDTGLAHLGAALALPSVGIIVNTPASLFSLVGEGPCRTLGDAGRPPSAGEVFAACRQALAGKEAQP